MTVMSKARRHALRKLEGHRVSVALTDGSRIDDGHLVSIGGNGTDAIWLFTNNTDVFVPAHEVADLWESPTFAA